MTSGKRRSLVWLAVVVLLWLAAPAWGQSPYERKPLPPPPWIEPEPSIENAAPLRDPSRNDISVPASAPSAEPCQSPFGNVGTPSFSRSCESWGRRPYSIGWFAGMVQGGPIIDDWVGMNQGFLGGYRLGWDHDPHWGAEMRFALSSVELYDSERAKQAQWDADTKNGYVPDSPWRRRFEQRRDANLFQWDVDLVYYPWGDTLWRPYLMVGLGTTSIHFMDRLSDDRRQVAFSLPVGAGVKYLWTDRVGLRLDLTNDIAFGGKEINTLQNTSLTAGVEIRLGGTQRAYWPWNPSRHYW